MVDQLTDLEDRIMELKSENEMLKSENFSLKYANENLKKDYYKTKKNLELLEGFTKRDVKELRAILTSQIKNKFGISRQRDLLKILVPRIRLLIELKSNDKGTLKSLWMY